METIDETQALTLAEDDAPVQELLAPETEDGPKVINFSEIVQKTLALMQNVFMQGDQVAQVRINPSFLEGFRIAFEAMPDDVVTPEFKQGLPIVADENEPQLRLVTRNDLELLELQRFFGPRDQGGNGLLPQLIEAYGQLGTPVRITPDVLRVLYALEVKKTRIPEIITPAGHVPLSGMDLRRR